jgi:hypothetical protein
VTTTTNWMERHLALLAASDDDELHDRLSEAFDADWKNEYVGAFVPQAMARGWSRKDAEDWAFAWEDAALLYTAPEHAWCPVKVAELDVQLLEIEAATAC